MEKDFLVYIDDMLEAISNGIAFTDRISFIEFSEDERTKYAVIRAIEIIGEASKKVPLEIKSQYLEWNDG